MLKQPEGSNLCGQTCLAMLANIEIDEAAKIVGKGGKTYNRDIIKALKKLKIRCASKSVRGEPTCDIAFVKIHFKCTTMRHWVLWFEGMFCDPGCGGVYESLTEKYKDYARIVSHIPVHLN
jgi:hypothetical protein